MNDVAPHLAIALAASVVLAAIVGPLRSIRGKGARAGSLLILGSIPLVLWALSELAFAGLIPEWTAFIPAAMALGFVLCQDCGVRLTGGYRPVAALGLEALAVERLALDASRGDDPTMGRRVEARLERLSGLRYSAAASEYIDLLTTLSRNLAAGIHDPQEDRMLSRLAELRVGFKPELEGFPASKELQWWASTRREREASRLD